MRLLLLSLLASTLLIGQQPNFESQINTLVSQMTLEEKAGQLNLLTTNLDITGPTIRSDYEEQIKAGRLGALFNAFTSKFTREIQQVAVRNTRLKIPLLFGYDVIHGYKTIFPIPLGEAASWDLEAIESAARIAAIEASAAGLHWTFAPMVDISRDPRWGRIAEGAGEDPYLASQISVARVRGFQGKDLAATDTILACAKHFAAYGAAEAGRDYNTVDISRRTLHEIYLPPFKACLDNGVATFMTAFNELNGVPCSGNNYLLNDILREQWKFKGFVVSDYTSINEMILHGFNDSNKTACIRALNAGLDMDMQGSIFISQIPNLVKSGLLSEATVDRAVKRILRLKFRLGLFEDPFRYSNSEREAQFVFHKDHLATARDVARKSIVLLRNENNTLPLRKDIKTIAVIGPLATNQSELIGSWSAAGDYKKCIDLVQGIKNKVAAQVLHAKGCDFTGNDRQGFAQAFAVAQQADVIVMALGEKALMSGEAASRADIDLPHVQQLLLQKICSLNKPVVLVLMNGRPLTINWASNNVPAILETWFLGTQAGNAIADVLFGDYNPSAKLPVTFPRSVGQIPLYYNHKNTGRPISENKYTSKYLDVANTPLYPFGFGLSYTSFAYSDLQLSSKEIQSDEDLQVTVTLTNTGKRAGTEIVQLYLRDYFASVTRPVKQLRRFSKVHLQPQQKTLVKFSLSRSDFEFYNAQLQKVVEAGKFKVMVGSNSQDYLEADFLVTEK